MIFYTIREEVSEMGHRMSPTLLWPKRHERKLRGAGDSAGPEVANRTALPSSSCRSPLKLKAESLLRGKALAGPMDTKWLGLQFCLSLSGTSARRWQDLRCGHLVANAAVLLSMAVLPTAENALMETPQVPLCASKWRCQAEPGTVLPAATKSS